MNGQRTLRGLRRAAIGGALIAATTLVGVPAARGQTPGTFVNLEHVFNFPVPAPPALASRRGTDLEFYTARVPNRDYATGQLLDASGAPLPPGAPPVLVTRDFAIMGSYNGGAWVFDITDPEDVRFVRNIPCNQQQNDVQIKLFGGRFLLALSRDGAAQPCVAPAFGAAAGAGIAVFDVTDPFAFEPMYSFRNAGGAHNFTFHPTEPFGWVSTGDLPGGANHIPIIDFTDPDAPRMAADISVQGGPHDISFSPDGLRAYVASENNLRIYDTADPAAPVLISVTPNVGTYSHGLDPTPDRSVMVHTNESLALGGFFAGGTSVCPGEGLTFYRIDGSLERAPVPVGYFEANIVGPAPGDPRACTAHVGRIAANSKVVVLGWYRGGVRVVDFSNPSQPREIASAAVDGGEVWAAKFYRGPYIYAADMRRGFDVFRWTGQGPAPWVGVADLSVAKADAPEPATVGDTVTYTLDVTNAGPDPAIGVTVTDRLPAGVAFDGATEGCVEAGGVVTCDLGTLDPGGEASITIEVRTVEPGEPINTASVSSPADDPDPADNEASAATVVCSITGTAAGETLQGTPGRDVICGFGGDDTLRGLDGHDLLIGGEGADRLFGGAGDDLLRGGPGNDDLKGGEGDDRLFGGPGNDALNGGPGTDACSVDEDGGTTTDCEG